MNEELRLGRRIVVCYELLLIIVLATVAGLCLIYNRPWHKVAKRLIAPAMLLRPLANGSRWARLAHAAVLAFVAWWMFRFGLRHPSPQVWSVCGPMSFVLAWLSGMIGFSRGVSAYLAARRGEQSFALAESSSGRSAAISVESSALAARHGPSAHSNARVPDVCPDCGAGRQAFVVLCPYCGARRDEFW